MNTMEENSTTDAADAAASATSRAPASSASIPVPPSDSAFPTAAPQAEQTIPAITNTESQALGAADAVRTNGEALVCDSGIEDKPMQDVSTSTPLNDNTLPKPPVSESTIPNNLSTPTAATPFPLISTTTPMPTPSSSGRGRGRGPGRPRGSGRGGSTRGAKTTSATKKRKRQRSNSATSSLTDSSVEISTPAATTTKSGRNVTKPTAYIPPATQASPNSNTNNNTANVNGSGGPKKKRVYRRNPESAVCKVCLRGVSPASNMIVFCDGCNSPYHRYCHHPMIDQSVVDEVDKEWLCSACKPSTTAKQITLEGGAEDVDVEGYVSLEGIGVEQRRTYFSSISKSTLVSLLVKATTLRPDLPVYPPQGIANGRLTVYDVVPDEHPPNYPHPGHGLMKTLPPEKQDSKYLVDEEDKYGVFSHIYQADPVAANAALDQQPEQSKS